MGKDKSTTQVRAINNLRQLVAMYPLIGIAVTIFGQSYLIFKGRLFSWSAVMYANLWTVGHFMIFFIAKLFSEKRPLYMGRMVGILTVLALILSVFVTFLFWVLN